MSDVVGDAVSDRLQGGEPSRLRALVAATVIGFGAAVIAYKLLRGMGD